MKNITETVVLKTLKEILNEKNPGITIKDDDLIGEYFDSQDMIEIELDLEFKLGVPEVDAQKGYLMQFIDKDKPETGYFPTVAQFAADAYRFIKN